RKAMSVGLGRLGYEVLVCRSADEALEREKAHAGRIDLVISDVVLPGMDGLQLIEVLRKARPDLKVLLTSGYTEDTISKKGLSGSAIPFIEKPFTAADLARKAREVLKGRPIGS